MYLQNVISRKNSFLLASWRSMMKIAEYGSGSISQRHGSADPGPYLGTKLSRFRNISSCHTNSSCLFVQASVPKTLPTKVVLCFLLLKVSRSFSYFETMYNNTTQHMAVYVCIWNSSIKKISLTFVIKAIKLFSESYFNNAQCFIAFSS
jgi:hypothetical protein